MTVRRFVHAFFAVSLALFTSACSQPGINAGKKGGVAFIAFTGMLLLMGGALWFILGRND